MKTIHIQYFAILREQRGLSKETLLSDAETVEALYQELQAKFPLTFPLRHLRVAVNQEFKDLSTILRDGDHVVFIPPVAGG